MSFEKSLIEQCSPTLASLKTGNLFSIAYHSMAEIESDIDQWSQFLAPKGVKVCVLKVRDYTALVYVYRTSALTEDLSQSETRDYLKEYGYCFNSMEEAVATLKIRLANSDAFPHEIGLFLSYPLEDVTGFTCNKGKNCSHCGYWKVYGDQAECEKKFKKYDKCRDVYLKLWGDGRSVLQLTVAA